MGVAEMVALGLKLSLELWAAWGKTQGMTEAEIAKSFAEVRADFLARDPATLPN